MSPPILYFYNHTSPWSYLGHDRFLDVARRAGAQIAFRPCDSHAVFSVSGGLPVRSRSPQRQAYRLTDYIYRDEMFWGQDRLDFLERRLAASK